MEYASLLIEQAMHVVHYMMQAKTGGECHVKWEKRVGFCRSRYVSKA